MELLNQGLDFAEIQSKAANLFLEQLFVAQADPFGLWFEIQLKSSCHGFCAVVTRTLLSARHHGFCNR